MKVLILNSGMGRRMGDITSEHPKCMTEISETETILSRQLNIISKFGIKDVIITTGYFEEVLIEYCNSLNLSLNIRFIKNPLFDKTNYIYSIYCARKLIEDDIVLMHGDLVFSEDVFEKIINSKKSCMATSTTVKLPEKDFKAVIEKEQIKKIGIEFFDNAVAAQPLYKIEKQDWLIWLIQISKFCENGQQTCYAENAFNEVSDRCLVYQLDVKDELCNEVDTKEDLALIIKKLKTINNF